MKFTIIYSNHHKGNFNEELLIFLEQHLASQGHEYRVRDLYSMDFNAVLKTDDFEGISAGNTPADIATEQKHIAWADVVVFIYPAWWGGMPAILKGYIDRVFSWGFAYKSNSSGPYPLLVGKKALILSSMGQSKEDYERGMFAAMNRINEEGIFGFCGIEVTDQIYFPSIQSVKPNQKIQYFGQVSRSVAKIGQVQGQIRTVLFQA